ncbi:MAG: hypothetical protein NVS2B16_08350 [Chloroflexota bacterium]
MTSMNTPTPEQSIRESLLQERQTIRARMDAIALGASDAWTDSDGVPMSSDERDQALAELLGRHLGHIDDALHRLDSGTYGICADCGARIPPRRLEVVPFATLCINCQAKADKRANRRPS